jgi:hypothetical protein
MVWIIDIDEEVKILEELKQFEDSRLGSIGSKLDDSQSVSEQFNFFYNG